MNLPDATLPLWAFSLGILWLSIRAVIDVAKSDRSDNAKTGWITTIIGLPVVGLIFYWLCGTRVVSSGATPEQREAALKARLNAGTPDPRT